MGLQKYADGEISANNYVYFSFYAEEFDMNIITKIMGIEPTSVKSKEVPVPIQSSWNYRIDAGSDIDLASYIDGLIDIFESKVETINQLKSDFHLESIVFLVIDIDFNPESSTPYFGLNKRTIDFLYKTKTTIDFDLYKIVKP